MTAEICPWETALLLAAASGDIAKLQEELDNEEDINSPDIEYGRTPLFWAAERGHDDVLLLLLRHGADIDSTEPSLGRTPLFAAIASRHEAEARHLIEAGACIETHDTRGETPLHLAAREGQLALVKLLLGAGSEKDDKDRLRGQTPLSLASAKGHKDVVKLLLRSNAAAGLPDDRGRKPVAWAIENGHDEIVRILEAADPESADPESTDNDERGSDEDRLASAMLQEDAVKVKLLLEQGTDLDLKGNFVQGLLVWAAKKGHEDVTSILLEKDIDSDSKDEEGQTPLFHAAEAGQGAVASLLLDKKADIHSREGREMTPLTVAAIGGHEGVVSLLLERGADPDPRDHDGWSPLLHATVGGHAGAMSLLLERGADSDIRDGNGMSLISCAAASGDLAAVKVLLARNVSPNDDESDETPLSTALDSSFDTKDYSMVKLLIDHGADPFSEAYWDHASPLELAAANGIKEMVVLFLEANGGSRKVKQDHVREAICKAAIRGREDMLPVLFEHYSPEDTETETPLERVWNSCCDCKVSAAVRLLRPYLSPGMDDDGEASMDDDSVRGFCCR